MRHSLLTYPAIAFLLLASSPDVITLSPIEEISARYRFNIAGWELQHFPSKWFRELGKVTFPFTRQKTEPQILLDEFFDLEENVRYTENQINRMFATGQAVTKERLELENSLSKFRKQRGSLRLDVEAILEAEISTLLREQEIPLNAGRLLFPPVDFTLIHPPLSLAISPRNHIERVGTILLDADVPIAEREALERRILHEENMAALVMGMGGLSTYPSIIASGDLQRTLVIASHEWLHQYLFFRPLGFNVYQSQEMRTLNETTANIFGNELGNLLYTRIMGEAPQVANTVNKDCPPSSFCFRKEMHHTRLETEKLLAQGKIREAEAYMEERRLLFVENGYLIRKINQAYFSHLGTYADNPASISPIFNQLVEMRQLSGSLARFIHLVSSVSSYSQFTQQLEELQNPQ